MNSFTAFALLTILLCGLTIRCTIGEPHAWKYCGGHHFGDWIEFDSGHFKISNDTVYKKNSAIGYVYRKESRLTDKMICIRTLDQLDSGRYCSK